MLGSVIPASQPASNKSRLRFRDNHRSSYDTPLSASEHLMAASVGAKLKICGGSRHAKIKGKPGWLSPNLNLFNFSTSPANSSVDD
jgi:hypothetical protein